MGSDEGFSDGLDLGGGATREFDLELVAGFAEPIDEAFSGENGSGGDGEIAFGFGALFEENAASAFHERAFDEFGFSELVAEGARAIGSLGEKIFDCFGMAPSEEAVEVMEFLVELIVAFGADDNHRMGGAWSMADELGESADSLVGADAFAVLNSGFDERAGDGLIDKAARDDEGTEEVPFAAFIDAKMWSKHFWLSGFFVSEASFTEDFWFEAEGDKVLGAFALEDDLGTFFVYGDVQTIFDGVEEGVGFWGKLIAVGEEDGLEFRGLEGGEGRGVEGDGWGRIRIRLLVVVSGHE